MKIFILYPLVSTTDIYEIKQALRFPPLGLAYIAAALIKNGHEVKLLDRNIVSLKNGLDLSIVDKQTISEITNFSPDIIGFSATTPSMHDVKYFSGIVRKIMPGKKLILGGAHPTIEPEESLRICKAIDIVVRGEGERTIVNLADNLDKLSDFKGITFREGENIISNEDVEQISNLDDIPMPRRDLLDMGFYCKPMIARGLYGRFTTIFTSRGCYGRCNFCAGYKVFAGRVRYHSPERVLSEIEEIISRYKIDYLYFAEDEFLSDRKRAEELCALLIKKNINKKIKWIAQIRPEKNRVNKELVKLAQRAGCVQLEIGFESGSQEELDRMNKKAKVEDYYYIMRLLKESGMRFQANFILKYPGQTMEDLAKTISLIKNSRASLVQANAFWALPGSRVYEELKEKSTKLRGIFNIGADENLSAISDEEYGKVINVAYNPLKSRVNKKDFILFHFFHKPLFLLDFSVRYILTRILRALIVIIRKKYFFLEVWQ